MLEETVTAEQNWLNSPGSGRRWRRSGCRWCCGALDGLIRCVVVGAGWLLVGNNVEKGRVLGGNVGLGLLF